MGHIHPISSTSFNTKVKKKLMILISVCRSMGCSKSFPELQRIACTPCSVDNESTLTESLIEVQIETSYSSSHVGTEIVFDHYPIQQQFLVFHICRPSKMGYYFHSHITLWWLFASKFRQYRSVAILDRGMVTNSHWLVVCSTNHLLYIRWDVFG